MENHVPLERQFSPVPKSEAEAESYEFLTGFGHVTQEKDQEGQRT